MDKVTAMVMAMVMVIYRRYDYRSDKHGGIDYSYVDDSGNSLVCDYVHDRDYEHD